eukprot:365627-Chlamydomonas_euryale.AAC.1
MGRCFCSDGLHFTAPSEFTAPSHFALLHGTPMDLYAVLMHPAALPPQHPSSLSKALSRLSCPPTELRPQMCLLLHPCRPMHD